MLKISRWNQLSKEIGTAAENGDETNAQVPSKTLHHLELDPLYRSQQIPPHLSITTQSIFVLFSNQFLLFQHTQDSTFFKHTPSIFFFCWTFFFPPSWKMSATSFSGVVTGSTYAGLTSNCSKIFPQKDSVSWSKKTVSNGSKTHCMKVKLLTQILMSTVLVFTINTNLNLTDLEPHQQQEVRDPFISSTSLRWIDCKGDWLHDQKGMDPLSWIRRGTI